MGFLQQRKLKSELKEEQLKNNAAKLRAQTLALEMQASALERYRNSGYSNGGASHSATWASQYHSRSASPKSDIEQNRQTLRERTRDMAMNAPLATAAVGSTRTNCIGQGLIPKPKINHEFLGISKEEGQRLQDQIKNEFGLWAESTLCDAGDQNNFYELQQIAFLDWLKNGEAFALVTYEKEQPYMPYQLRIKLVEADRVSTPGSFGEYDGFDKKLPSGNAVMNGIELDSNGKVVAYHISSYNPKEISSEPNKWTRVERRGKKTGNLNVLHIYNAERSEQYRGVPFLAPVIQTLHQLTQYTEAEIMAAVINAMLAVFITSETGNDVGGFGGVDETPDYGDASEKIKLGSGTVTYLRKGEKVEAVESKHPSGSYDGFVQSIALQVGAALEIAPEVLLKQFKSNFSASRGALNETWRAFSMRRKWFVDDFCQAVYDMWMAEAVSKGRINAPGFFLDPLIRKAYTRTTWNGPAQSCLNPVQEVNAAVQRIGSGLSTHEDECAALNGSDFDDNVRTLASENEKLLAATVEEKANEDN